MRVFVLLLSLLSMSAAWAGGPSLDQLFGSLRRAVGPAEAAPLEKEILVRFQHSGSDSVELLLSRADEVLASGDKATANKLLKAVTDLEPNFAEGWRFRAHFAADQNDDRAAIIYLQKTVALNRRHFAAMVELGEMLEEYGDTQTALKLFRRALSLDPQFEGLAHKVEALTRSVEGQGI
jgi:tetratricopeptide (TPR) repeat protein